ncbi:hypothetical protein HDU99_002853, partial [Rhizoclosmatium hyalinum]
MQLFTFLAIASTLASAAPVPDWMQDLHNNVVDVTGIQNNQPCKASDRCAGGFVCCAVPGASGKMACIDKD